jgi:hypothetical protein
MSLRAAVLAFAGACAILSPPVNARSEMQAAEQLLIPFSDEEWRQWKVGAQAKLPNFTMVEYIPTTRVMENWDRMLTVQIFHNSAVPLAQFMGRMKAAFETKCESTQLGSLSGKVNGYDTSQHWLSCSRNKQSGKGEITLTVGIQGRDALYLVQRAARGEPYAADAGPLPKTEQKAWVTFAKKVRICDPRVAENPCPKGLQRAQ